MPEEEKKEESKPEPVQVNPPAVPENKIITLGMNPPKESNENRD
jgi:hypothetical protein